MVSYRLAGSAFGAAHGIDLPLLLGTPAAWAATPLLGRATWPQGLAAPAAVVGGVCAEREVAGAGGFAGGREGVADVGRNIF